MKRLCIAVILLLSFSSSNLLAQVINLNIGQHDWPPYIISDSKDHKGIMVDVFLSIAKELNHQVVIHHHSTKRGQQSLALGEIDVIARAKEWVETPDSFLWTDPVMNSEDVIIHRQGQKFSDIVQLNKKVVCTVIGYSYPQLTALFANGTLIRADARDTEAMIATLQRQHCDAAVTNIDVFNWHNKMKPEITKGLEASKIVVGSAPYRFQFTKNKKWEKIISQFNQRLRRMKSDGSLEQIMSQYR